MGSTRFQRYSTLKLLSAAPFEWLIQSIGCHISAREVRSLGEQVFERLKGFISCTILSVCPPSCKNSSHQLHPIVQLLVLLQL